MLFDHASALPAAVPPGSRLLGLDVGSKTIGTALSDTRLVIASPLETIRRRGRFRDDAAALFALIDRHGVGGLVIGLPLALSGGESFALSADGAVAFVGNDFGYTRRRADDDAILERVVARPIRGRLLVLPGGERLVSVSDSEVTVIDLR